jgi:hypothetical protein
MMKALHAKGVEWSEDYRGAARQALAALLERRMDQLIDLHLERMAELGQADRPNWPRSPTDRQSSCSRRWPRLIPRCRGSAAGRTRSATC